MKGREKEREKIMFGFVKLMDKCVNIYKNHLRARTRLCKIGSAQRAEKEKRQLFNLARTRVERVSQAKIIDGLYREPLPPNLMQQRELGVL